MAADIENGVTLAENKGAWKDDPETLDTTDFTAEGNDYWKAKIAHPEDGGGFVADYEDIPGWAATDTSMEEGHELIKVVGTFQGAGGSYALTKAKKDALNLFFRKHSDLSDASFYYIFRTAVDQYDLYPDQNRSQKKYCEVRFVGKPKAKIVQRVLQFSFTLRSTWGS